MVVEKERLESRMKISALYSLQCFDTDGWVARRSFISLKTHLLILEILFQNGGKAEKLRGPALPA